MATAAPISTTRRAGRADTADAIGVLVRAFHDDPIVMWAFRTAQSRERYLPAFFGWYWNHFVDQGVSWTTDAHEGVAVWAQPGRWKHGALEDLQLVRAVARGIRRPLTTVIGLTSVEARHPAEPSLYLSLLGVDPGRQGRGIGSALITPGLDHCDEHRIPAYLETAKQRNLAFYERHGFAITGQLDLPRGGPRVWTMWRDPR